mmetsp:Transcript_32018/g.50008  ORF Transcript_32018/g.50008 Transcript_32018/m.50008 type:complete len:425 (-) Transcript_32018:284-1558(-)
MQSFLQVVFLVGALSALSEAFSPLAPPLPRSAAVVLRAPALRSGLRSLRADYEPNTDTEAALKFKVRPGPIRGTLRTTQGKLRKQLLETHPPTLDKNSSTHSVALQDPFSHKPYLSNWHCLGFAQRFDWTKPTELNIGDIPLVVWKNGTDVLVAPNVCKHLGSTLHEGAIDEEGCLVCPYHGLKHGREHAIGKTMMHQGKLYWTPDTTLHATPPSIPNINAKGFVHSFLEFDMDASLEDCAMNTMDVNHPGWVHHGTIGFGNRGGPTDVIHRELSDRSVSLQFKYNANRVVSATKGKGRSTKNFHFYELPCFTWSVVTFGQDRLLYIGADFLPLSRHKTRWFVTVVHNYYTNPIQKKAVEMAARLILSQDQQQMGRQSKYDDMRKLVSSKHHLPFEVRIVTVVELFCPFRAHALRLIYRATVPG